MFTRYAILRRVGPEVFYIDTLLIENEFLDKTAKFITLRKRRVNCFTTASNLNAFIVSSTVHDLHQCKYINRVSTCRKKNVP